MEAQKDQLEQDTFALRSSLEKLESDHEVVSTFIGGGVYDRALMLFPTKMCGSQLVSAILAVAGGFATCVAAYSCGVAAYHSVIAHSCTVSAYSCTVAAFSCTVAAFSCTVAAYSCTVAAFFALLQSFLALLQPFLALLQPFLEVLQPFLEVSRPFLALLQPFLEVLQPFLALLQPFLEVLHCFLTLLQPIPILEVLQHIHSCSVTAYFGRLHTLSVALNQLPTLYRIENKKGESLEDLDHVLDMIGHGWAWSGMM